MYIDCSPHYLCKLKTREDTSIYMREDTSNLNISQFTVDIPNRWKCEFSMLQPCMGPKSFVYFWGQTSGSVNTLGPIFDDISGHGV